MTLGSDAHAPEQVGRFFPEARALLRDAGYREVALLRAASLYGAAALRAIASCSLIIH